MKGSADLQILGCKISFPGGKGKGKRGGKGHWS